MNDPLAFDYDLIDLAIENEGYKAFDHNRDQYATWLLNNGLGPNGHTQFSLGLMTEEEVLEECAIQNQEDRDYDHWGYYEGETT